MRLPTLWLESEVGLAHAPLITQGHEKTAGVRSGVAVLLEESVSNYLRKIAISLTDRLGAQPPVLGSYESDLRC